MADYKRTKYNLDALFSKAYKMVKGAGIQPAPKKDISIRTSKAKTYWGNCNRKKAWWEGSVQYTISIAEQTFLIGSEAIINTLIHELLHTVEGCFGHGKEWKDRAELMNEKYGLHISRVTAPDELANKEVANLMVKQGAKYKISCVQCGAYEYRYRKSKVTKVPEQFRCKKCNGKIKLEVL